MAMIDDNEAAAREVESAVSQVAREVESVVDEVSLLILSRALDRLHGHLRQAEPETDEVKPCPVQVPVFVPVEPATKPATKKPAAGSTSPKSGKRTPESKPGPHSKYDEAVVKDWLVTALRNFPGSHMASLRAKAKNFPYPTMHQTGIQRIANKFEADGVLRREGEGRNTRWFVVGTRTVEPLRPGVKVEQVPASPVEPPRSPVAAPEAAPAPTPGVESEPPPSAKPEAPAAFPRPRAELGEVEKAILEALRERPRSYGSMKLTMFPSWQEGRLNQVLADMRAQGLIKSHPGKAGFVIWQLQEGVK